jgi:hypothetical protein
MENLAIYLNSLAGKWINKATNQKVKIQNHVIDIYIAEYDPPMLESQKVKEEKIYIVPLSYNDCTCKLTNCLGSWTLKFLSRDKVLISNNPDLNQKAIACTFVRII